MHSLLMIFFGLLTGFLGGYTGLAGAPVLVALSVTFAGYSQHEAQGIILAVMLGPMTLTGIIAMKDKIRKLLPYAIISVISYAVFSYMGASFAFLLNDKYLKFYFGLMLITIGIFEIVFLLVKTDVSTNNRLIPFNYLSMMVLGIFTGTIGGMFGIGGGILMIPVMTRLMKVHKDDARALSLMILLPPVSIGAVIKYQTEGSIDWVMAVTVFMAYIVMNYFGSALGRKHPEKHFKFVFSLAMIMLGVSYLSF